MKIVIHTIRTMSKEELVSYCGTLREIGVPIETIRELLITGKGKWTTEEDGGGTVTTSYEVIDSE